MKPFVKSETTHLLLQLRYYFLRRRPNVANNMILGVKLRSQVTNRGKFSQNHSLKYMNHFPHSHTNFFLPFPTYQPKNFLGKKIILGTFSLLCSHKSRLCTTEYFTMNILKSFRNKEVFWPRAQCIHPLQPKPRSGYYCPWAFIVAKNIVDFLPLFSIIIINNLNGPVSLTGLKRPGCDVVHSHLSSIEVRNEWSYTSTLHIYTFMVCTGASLAFLRNDIFGSVSTFFLLVQGLSYFIGGWKVVKGRVHGQISATVLVFTWTACRIVGVQAEIRTEYLFTISSSLHIFPLPMFQATEQKWTPYLQAAVCLRSVLSAFTYVVFVSFLHSVFLTGI